MLDQAARYYPILRILKQHQLFSSESILEIGAGPTGLGQFRKISFVGSDLSFVVPPVWPMTPIVATGTALPFADQAFDAVLASDVIEHVPAGGRAAVIRECLRVARKLAIVGFPCGPIAQTCDTDLFDIYARKRMEPPVWLKEHMLEDFPESSLFAGIPDWHMSAAGNENIRFHFWMMRMEMHRLFNYAAKASLLVMPWFVEALLRRADSAPYYRQIFVLHRTGV